SEVLHRILALARGLELVLAKLVDRLGVELREIGLAVATAAGGENHREREAAQQTRRFPAPSHACPPTSCFTFFRPGAAPGAAVRLVLAQKNPGRKTPFAPAPGSGDGGDIVPVDARS